MCLDCILVGYNDFNFDFNIMMLGNIKDGTYRDLRMNYIDYNNKRLPYMEVLNEFLLKRNRREIPQKDYLHCGKLPNLGAVYLKNYLNRYGMNSEIVNLFQYEKDSFKELLKKNPVAVAITTTFYTTPYPIIEIVDFIRKNNKNTKIIIGGPYVYLQQKQVSEEQFQILLKSLNGDIYVTESQGEEALGNIISSIKEGKGLEKINNIYYKKEDKFIRNEEKAECNNLDENIIDWDVFSDSFLGETIQTRTARSCPFSCSFCAYPARAGKHVQTSLDKVKEELTILSKHKNVENILFIDDTFNVPVDRFKDFCRMLIKSNLKFNWYSYLRCQYADKETIELMKESGCKGVFLGIESGDQQILNNMNKKVTVEKYIDGIKWLNEYGITSFACFMVGFPGETRETINNTIEFIEKAKPTFFRAMLWYHDAVTPIHSEREKFGIVGDKFSWRHNTMDYEKACDEIDRILLTVKNSIWMPQYNFDFWCIPYLLGKGITIEQLKEFLNITNKLLKVQITTKDKYKLNEAGKSFEKEMDEFSRRVNLKF